jgi:hypothetical protein
MHHETPWKKRELLVLLLFSPLLLLASVIILIILLVSIAFSDEADPDAVSGYDHLSDEPPRS